MKTRFYWIILLIMIYSSVSAQSLLSKADSLELQYKFYVWTDSTTIYLTSFGSLERQFPGLMFKRIDYDINGGLTSIEGLVDVCCFEILVAKALKNDKLTNIRRFGKTEEIAEVLKDERFTGRFSIKTKLAQDDLIIIGHPGTLYWGATIVPLGKVFAN